MSNAPDPVAVKGTPESSAQGKENAPRRIGRFIYIALILFNLIPLAGTLFLRGNSMMMLVIYWWDTGAMYFFSILGVCCAPSIGTFRQRLLALKDFLFMGGVFLALGPFLASAPMILKEIQPNIDLGSPEVFISKPVLVCAGLTALRWTIWFLVPFLLMGNYRQATILDIMKYPGTRVVTLFLIVAFGLTLSTVFSSITLFMWFTVVLMILMDLSVQQPKKQAVGSFETATDAAEFVRVAREIFSKVSPLRQEPLPDTARWRFVTPPPGGMTTGTEEVVHLNLPGLSNPAIALYVLLPLASWSFFCSCGNLADGLYTLSWEGALFGGICLLAIWPCRRVYLFYWPWEVRFDITREITTARTVNGFGDVLETQNIANNTIREIRLWRIQRRTRTLCDVEILTDSAPVRILTPSRADAERVRDKIRSMTAGG